MRDNPIIVKNDWCLSKKQDFGSKITYQINDKLDASRSTYFKL